MRLAHMQLVLFTTDAAAPYPASHTAQLDTILLPSHAPVYSWTNGSACSDSILGAVIRPVERGPTG